MRARLFGGCLRGPHTAAAAATTSVDGDRSSNGSRRPVATRIVSSHTHTKLLSSTVLSSNAPVEHRPVEDAPVEDAPSEDAPVKDAPSEDAPVEDVPARRGRRIREKFESFLPGRGENVHETRRLPNSVPGAGQLRPNSVPRPRLT